MTRTRRQSRISGKADRQEYLGDDDEDKLQEGLYAGLIYGLDDVYSRYYTAEEYDQENATTEGCYVGIGVSMQKNKERWSTDC